MQIPTELHQITVNPESLNRLTLPELEALWRRCCPKRQPSPHRTLLIRDLAFVAQSGGEFGLPRETDVLIKAAMRTASVSRSLDEASQTGKHRLPSARAAHVLPVGSVLMREWGGESHRVTVLAGGSLEYRGQNYKSLTKVAKAITGAHWSGPCFFGLHKFRRSP